MELREPSQRVSPRARVLWTAGAVVQVAAPTVVLAALAGPFDAFDVSWWAWAVWAVVAAAYVVVMPRWRYRVHRWEATDTAVYTQTGWWVRERRVAPMSRIQTVDHTEGALARVLGLASVTVTTASSAGALQIDGLERERARVLVDELTRRADQVSGDAT